MEDPCTFIEHSLTQLLHEVGPSAPGGSGASAAATLAAMEKYTADHTESLMRSEATVRRMWDLVCPLHHTPAGADGVSEGTSSFLSLFCVLSTSVRTSSKTPHAVALKSLASLLCRCVSPPLVRGAAEPQLHRLYDATSGVVRALGWLGTHSEVLAGCLALLAELLRVPEPPLRPHTVEVTAQDVESLVESCVTACAEGRRRAVRPRAAALQLLGALCEREHHELCLSPLAAKSIHDCLARVVADVASASEVAQTLVAGLLDGLGGYFSGCAAHDDEAWLLDALLMNRVNDIVLRSLRIGAGSTCLYHCCRAALGLLRRHANFGALRIFVVRHAAEYVALLRALWLCRSREVRREARPAVAAFWVGFACAAQQLSQAEDGFDVLSHLLTDLQPSLCSNVDREVCFALEALSHLLPVVSELESMDAVQRISEHLEGHLRALLTASHTEALLRQASFLLSALGQLLMVLPAVTPRQASLLRALMETVLLLFPHPAFYERAAIGTGLLELLAALVLHPRTPDPAWIDFLCRRTLQLVSEAPAAAVGLSISGTVLTTDQRLRGMAHLWSQLLGPLAAGAEMERRRTAQQLLRVEFLRCCADLCEEADLSVVLLAPLPTPAAPEQILVDGVDAMQPANYTQYRQFLAVVDFLVRLFHAVGAQALAVETTAVRTALTVWLTSLVGCARRWPHVSGFLALLHQTLTSAAMVLVQPAAVAALGGSTATEYLVAPETEFKLPLLSPLICEFLCGDCTRQLSMYSGELLYQCAMCVVMGAYYSEDAVLSDYADNSHESGDGEPYVRAFEVVLTAAVPKHATLSSEPREATGSASVHRECGSTSYLIEHNRRCALRVLTAKVHASPRWATVLLPPLVAATAAALSGDSAVAHQQLCALAARHGVSVSQQTQSLQHAVLCSIGCIGSGVSTGGMSESLDEVTALPTDAAATCLVALDFMPTVSAVDLSHLIPLVCRCCLSGGSRALRVAAATTVRFCLLWVVQQGNEKCFSALLAAVLALASREGSSESEPPVSFRSQVVDTARQLAVVDLPSAMSERLVAALLLGLSAPEAALRRVATEALLAFACPSSPASLSESSGDAALAVVTRLAKMASGNAAQARLGAVHCLHVLMKRLRLQHHFPCLSPTHMQMVHGAAIACLRRCVEVPVWGVLERSTCGEVHGLLVLLCDYYRSDERVQEKEHPTRLPPTVSDAEHTQDISAATASVLCSAAGYHINCAVALLNALTAFSETVTQAYAADLLTHLVNNLQQLLFRQEAADDSVVADVCAGFVAVLRSDLVVHAHKAASLKPSPNGSSGEHTVHDALRKRRREDELPDVLLPLLHSVIASFKKSALQAKREGRHLSPHLVRWAAELLYAMPRQSCASALATLTQSSSASTLSLSDLVDLLVHFLVHTSAQAAVSHSSSAGVVKPLHATPSPLLTVLIPQAPIQQAIQLLQLMFDLADETWPMENLCDRVLDALVGTGALDCVSGDEAARFLGTLTTDPASLALSLALLAAVGQVRVAVSSPQRVATVSLWSRVAVAQQGSYAFGVRRRLHSALRNSHLLHSRDGNAVCVALVVLLFYTAEGDALAEYLQDLFDLSGNAPGAALTHLCVCSAESRGNEVSVLGDSAWGALERCWRRGLALLADDVLLSVFASLCTTLINAATGDSASPAAGDVDANALPLLFRRVVLAGAAELETRRLSKAQQEQLLPVCTALLSHEVVRRANSSVEGGVADSTRLTLVACMLRIGGRALMQDARARQLLCDLASCVGVPQACCDALDDSCVADQIVWSLEALTLALRVATDESANVAVVAHRLLSVMFSSVVAPQAPVGSRDAQRERRYAGVMRAATALFIALLPHRDDAAVPLLPLLALPVSPLHAQLLSEVTAALSSLSASRQVGMYSCIVNVLHDPHTQLDVHCGVAQHLLLPLLRTLSRVEARTSLFAREVVRWVQNADLPVTSRGSCGVQTAALLLLAHLFEVSSEATLRGSLNAAFVKSPGGSGRELTVAVAALCRRAWLRCHDAKYNTGDTPPDARLEYSSAAFHCLVIALARTRQSEEVLCRCFLDADTVTGWNALSAHPPRFIGGEAGDETAVESAAERLLSHLCHHFGPMLATTNEAAPPPLPLWLDRTVCLLSHPELHPEAQLLLFRGIAAHAGALAPCLPRVFNRLARTVAAAAAVAPEEGEERNESIAWGLLCCLVALLRHHTGCSAPSIETKLVVSALLRYAVFHTAAAGETRLTSPHNAPLACQTSVAGLTDVVAVLHLAGAGCTALSAADIHLLLSCEAYDKQAAVKALQVVVREIGCLSVMGTAADADRVHATLLSLLTPAASADLFCDVAALLGLEHQQLRHADSAGACRTADLSPRLALEKRVVALLRCYDSDRRLPLVLDAMQQSGGDALAHAVLTAISPLHHYHRQKEADKLRTLRVLTRAEDYVVENYTSVHRQLFQGLESSSRAVLLSLYTLLRAVATRLPAAPLQLLLDGFCSAPALTLMRRDDACCSAFCSTAIAALTRCAVLAACKGVPCAASLAETWRCTKERVLSEGLRESSPLVVHRLLLEYWASHTDAVESGLFPLLEASSSSLVDGGLGHGSLQVRHLTCLLLARLQRSYARPELGESVGPAEARQWVAEGSALDEAAVAPPHCPPHPLFADELLCRRDTEKGRRSATEGFDVMCPTTALLARSCGPLPTRSAEPAAVPTSPHLTSTADAGCADEGADASLPVFLHSLQVLCAHDDDVAARTLADILCNIDADACRTHQDALQKIVHSLLRSVGESGERCHVAPHLFVVQEVLRQCQTRGCPLSLDTAAAGGDCVAPHTFLAD